MIDMFDFEAENERIRAFGGEEAKENKLFLV